MPFLKFNDSQNANKCNFKIVLARRGAKDCGKCSSLLTWGILTLRSSDIAAAAINFGSGGRHRLHREYGSRGRHGFCDK